jgi:metal-responsive CopG/Arc/MetJ family transcriptional regulator
MERVNISIERGLLRAIDATARKRGMTRSSFLAASARRDLVGNGELWRPREDSNPQPAA